MIACVVDFFVFFSDGKPGIFWRIVNMVGNTYCFMANPIFVACWCLYEDLIRRQNDAIDERLFEFI